MHGYDFEAHLAEIGRAKGGGLEPAKSQAGPSAAPPKLLAGKSSGENQMPKKASSASVLEAKKESARPRHSNPSTASGGAPAGRAQKNEQKYNQALKSAMKGGDDHRD